MLFNTTHIHAHTNIPIDRIDLRHCQNLCVYMHVFVSSYVCMCICYVLQSAYIRNCVNVDAHAHKQTHTHICHTNTRTGTGGQLVLKLTDLVDRNIFRPYNDVSGQLFF